MAKTTRRTRRHERKRKRTRARPKAFRFLGPRQLSGTDFAALGPRAVAVLLRASRLVTGLADGSVTTAGEVEALCQAIDDEVEKLRGRARETPAARARRTKMVNAARRAAGEKVGR